MKEKSIEVRTNLIHYIFEKFIKEILTDFSDKLCWENTYDSNDDYTKILKKFLSNLYKLEIPYENRQINLIKSFLITNIHLLLNYRHAYSHQNSNNPILEWHGLHYLLSLKKLLSDLKKFGEWKKIELNISSTISKIDKESKKLMELHYETFKTDKTLNKEENDLISKNNVSLLDSITNINKDLLIKIDKKLDGSLALNKSKDESTEQQNESIFNTKTNEATEKINEVHNIVTEIRGMVHDIDSDIFNVFSFNQDKNYLPNKNENESNIENEFNLEDDSNGNIDNRLFVPPEDIKIFEKSDQDTDIDIFEDYEENEEIDYEWGSRISGQEAREMLIALRERFIKNERLKGKNIQRENGILRKKILQKFVRLKITNRQEYDEHMRYNYIDSYQEKLLDEIFEITKRL